MAWRLSPSLPGVWLIGAASLEDSALYLVGLGIWTGFPAELEQERQVKGGTQRISTLPGFRAEETKGPRGDLPPDLRALSGIPRE